MSAADAGSGGVPDRGPAVFAVTTATLVLASVFVAARLYTRLGIVRNISWDDYFIVLAWFLAFGLSFTIDLGATKGLGRYDADIVADDWNDLRRCEYVFSIIYNPALMATKTSILIFYLRLSRNTQQVLRFASWVVLGVVNVAGTVLTLLNIFQCRPVQAAFDRYSGDANCIPLLTEFICSAPVNIVTDLAILALPLPVLTGMRIPYRQKIILVLTFTLGIFVTIVDVVRIYYLQQAITAVSPGVSNNLEATFGDQANFAWNASLSLMWSAVEVNVGIACACIPTLKPLFVRILPAMIIDPDGTLRKGSDTEKQPSDSSRMSHTARGPMLGPVLEPQEAQPAQRRASHSQGSSDSQITALDFLTTPDMTGPAGPTSPTFVPRTSITMTSADNSVYFGFVNMKRPKSMIRTSARDSFKYCTVVTILFVLWGFSYGLLNTLNNVIATVADMTVAQTLGLTSMYFGAGYFFGPLIVGEWILRHDEHRRTKKSNGMPSIGGFKATFMLGLCIYGTGTIMFWPSAVLTSFAGFMISSFIVGFGLAVLETAANPFLALCGPMDYAEMRLLLAQGVQAVATVVAGVLAQKVFFTQIGGSVKTDSATLLDVQWTYLAITLLCVLLALFFYYMPLPEVTDAEMENSTRWLPVDPKKRSVGGLELRTWTLSLAVLAQWCYVAGQEIMSIFFRGLLTPDNSGDTATNRDDHPAELSVSISDYLLIGHTAFAISRFFTAYLAYLSPTHPKVPQPRTVLTICTGLTIVSAILVAALRPKNNPNLLAIPAILFFFSEGPMWPLIFALGLRGQGKHTKCASAWITMGASGPAFWPFVIYGIKQAGRDYQIAFIVVPALLVIMSMFSLFLDLKRDARSLVDARVGAEEQLRIIASGNEELDLHNVILRRRRTGSIATEHPPNFVKRLSMTLGKGLGHLRRNSGNSEPATTEHHEVKRYSPG
ncbi:L-fucose permease [Pseudomassariella vexata]|uniref:L-fucose permease n=1 Tax=Pseudomassariella vexata TaxID=1141098 RepID=A0A1Y2E0T2_9PEZI|nr:L-fucose permease [Pseudomassariella vexata]ORY65087.1 L-fucose permease [Pseudomassariella vexata]